MSSRTDPFAVPVEPTNTRRPRRRDPDAPTETAAAVATPPAAAPNPTGQEAAVAHTDTTGGTLGAVLAPNTTTTSGDQRTTTTPAQDSISVLTGLARMRQTPVDPYTDYVGDGTRKLRWVQQAIEQVAQLTGRTRQDVETRALLGLEPLPADVLEANWRAIYGYPRSQYQPPNR